MKPIPNISTCQFKPGDMIILMDGKNVPLGDGFASYDWYIPEEIEGIVGDTIYFKGYPNTTCYKTYMPWKVVEDLG